MGRLAPTGIAGLAFVLAGACLTAIAPASHAEGSVSAPAPDVRVQPRVATFDDTYFEAGSITASTDGTTPANPASVAISSDDTVYVANSYMGTVEVINPGQVDGATDDSVQVIPATGFPSPSNLGLFGIAVDPVDDTVYVVNRAQDSSAKTLWAINGRTLSIDDSVTLPCQLEPDNLAAYRFITVGPDHGVYVPCQPGTSHGGVVVVNGRDLDDSTPIFGGPPDPTIAVGGIAVDPVDDTIYTAGWWGPSRVQVNDDASMTMTDAFISPDLNTPQGVALLDDTLYVTNYAAPSLVAFDVNSGGSATFPLGSNPSTDVAADPTGSLLFVTGYERLWILSVPDGVERQRFEPAGFDASSVVVSSSGLVYTGSDDPSDGLVKVFAPETPSAASAITGTAGYEQVAASWTPPSFVGNVRWYRVTASPGGKTCIAQAPATTCVVGGLTAGTPYTFAVQAMNSTGSWGPASAPSAAVTPLAPPSPGPGPGPGPSPAPIPPSVPLSASATGGDERARVTWVAPSYSGSGPISVYRVTASPGGQTCFVDAPATACTVRDLLNGTPYTFRVQALNEGGWSQSATTPPVTPQGPIRPRIALDPGERTANGINDVVSTRGETTGIPAGTRLTPYVRYSRDAAYKAGVANVVVSADGSFTWSREVRRSKPLFAYMAFEGAESNIVIWVRLDARPTRAGVVDR